MTRARTWTLGSTLLLGALLTCGTAPSSAADPASKPSARKQPSNPVNKQQKQEVANRAADPQQSAAAQARSAWLSDAARADLVAKLKAGQSEKTAETVDKKELRVVPTPQTTKEQASGKNGSLPEAQRPPVDDAAVREALARRQAWTEPRRPLTEPAKVQDPPVSVQAGPSGDPAAADQGAGMGEGKLILSGEEPAGDGENEDLIREALRNRGKPYVWGGASRGGFDCSGFVVYLYKKMRGMDLPHSASAQSRLGTPVQREQLQPGDLVFFTTYRAGVSHVGIYIGNNQFIHAANTRKDVRIDSLAGYYQNRYKWARRVSKTPLKFNPSELRQMMWEPSETPGQTPTDVIAR